VSAWATHAYSINGHAWGELLGTFNPEDDELARVIGLLDGERRSTFILWKLPEGKTLDQVNPRTQATNYLQSGGNASHMTVEMRRTNDDGAEQLVVGRPGSDGDLTTLRWNGGHADVYERELFSAAEASNLFQEYRRTGGLPEGYVLRLRVL
jgi:hypothetical protein